MTPCGVLVGYDGAIISALLDRLDADIVRVDPGQLDDYAWPAEWSDESIVWLHVVPAGAGAGAVLSDASLLLHSAALARQLASDAGRSLTFIALIPSRGLFTGALGLACDLARGAFEGLMQNQIGEWSADGARLLGVVYAGLDEEPIEGQRPGYEVVRRTPAGVLGTVGQLADAITFLGSRHAAYVTGTLVHVDGGWNAYSWIYPARTI
jgi:NAD(P)-dependent dehydrogenase (short-subunit alcohol dehydrogenase family)